MSEVREAVERYKQQFAGGMIPFDTAYHEAVRDGHTLAEAQRLGVYGVLDALVAQLEDPDALYLDMRGMPVKDLA